MASTIRDEIAGIAVADIARDFGTPTYVYDLATIAARIAELRAFDVVRYAQKANSNLAVLDFVRRAGVLVDAVSAGEIHRAIAAGYPISGDPAPIVYTADVFDRESLDVIAEYGIAVNCGSSDMLAQYAERVPGGEVTLRVNPGFGHGHSKKTNTGGEHSKHGIWHEELPRALELAARARLRVTGLHLHIGSGADLEHLALVAGAAEKLAGVVGASLRTLSAGGGLPVPYRAGDVRPDIGAYFRIWDAARKRVEARLGRQLRLELEPGRYIVAESGFLIAEVRAVKRVAARTFVLLDAGFNALARPAMYGAYHPMSLAPSDDARRAELEVVVGGPLCESGDIFTQDEGGVVRTQRLAEARVGDFVVIECAGAYGFAMASNYNSKPRPAEVILRNGKALLSRARETSADMLRGELIPGE
ncbi:MAG TPA: diaminopimelate decarboxylase [Myxococcota bacterium]